MADGLRNRIIQNIQKRKCVTRELQQVRDYVFDAVEILGEASETYEQVDKDMEDGLGSALRKLYKGCNIESIYAKYKTKRG